MTLKKGKGLLLPLLHKTIEKMTPTSKFMSKKQKTNYRMLDHDHDSPGAGNRIWVVPEGS